MHVYLYTVSIHIRVDKDVCTFFVMALTFDGIDFLTQVEHRVRATRDPSKQMRHGSMLKLHLQGPSCPIVEVPVGSYHTPFVGYPTLWS